MKKGLEKKQNDISNCSMEDRYIAGPLNLNRTTKQADTAMGTQIKLNDRDFEALDLLATNVGEYVSFDKLYNAAWGASKETSDISHAKASLDNLVFQINTIGHKFMHIKCSHGDNYKLVTHWGSAWKGKSRNVNETAGMTDYSNNIKDMTGRSIKSKITSKRRGFMHKHLLTGAGAIVIAALITLLLYITGVISPTATESLYIDVEDPSVPLATPNFEE